MCWDAGSCNYGSTVATSSTWPLPHFLGTYTNKWEMYACTVEVVKTSVCVPSNQPYMGGGCIIEVDCMFCAVCMLVIFGARKGGCFRGGCLIEWPLDHRQVPLCLPLMRWVCTAASWPFQYTYVLRTLSIRWAGAGTYNTCIVRDVYFLTSTNFSTDTWV